MEMPPGRAARAIESRHLSARSGGMSMSARRFSRFFLVAIIILGAAVAGFSQTYRYLKIWVNNTNSHIDEHTFGVVETEWYVGSIAFPVTKMTSDDGPAPQKCWFERNGQKDNPAPGYWTYRMYDGEIGDTSKYTVDYKSKYATIGFEPYPFAWVLDLGDGNGIAPDSVWIRGLKDDRRVITELKCYGSNDGENWVLLGESDNPSHVENRLHFENAGGGAALSLLGPTRSSHLYVGETMKFLWYYNPDSVSGDLELSISPDSGVTWLPLPNQPHKDDMVYEWTIPEELNGHALVSPTIAVSIAEKGNEGSRKALYGINISPQGTNPFVVDNSDIDQVEIAGDWLASSASEGFEGADYIHDQGQMKSGKEVRYKPAIQRPGMYAVYGKWTSHENRAQAVPYTVQTVGGPITVTADQRTNGGEWVLLDTFALAQSEGQTVVTISSAGTSDGEIVIADALKFVYIAELSTPIVTNLHAGPHAIVSRPRFYSAIHARRISVPKGASSVVLFDLRGREIARYALGARSGSIVQLPAIAKAATVLGVRFE